MIFKYPEEFIVPVAYVQDLKDKTLYRCQETIINGEIIESELVYENINSILSDIDKDYANSETLNMKV